MHVLNKALDTATVIKGGVGTPSREMLILEQIALRGPRRPGAGGADRWSTGPFSASSRVNVRRARPWPCHDTARGAPAA